MSASTKYCAVLVLSAGCMAPTASPSGEFTKAQARQGQMKADHIDDICAELSWYGDGECDDFCPTIDPDCAAPEDTCSTDADCPNGYCAVRYYSSCPPPPSFCRPPPPPQCVFPNCGDGTVALCEIEPVACPEGQTLAVRNHCYDCVDARSCEEPIEPPFCARALCGPGYECNEELDRCVPVDDNFCATALCALGTSCNEDLDRCEPVYPPFCARVLCAPGYECDEVNDRCVRIDDDFCPRVRCAAGYECNEELDRCVPRDCGDGTVALCEIVPPECPAGSILAVRNHCFDCVDPLTCEEPIDDDLFCARVLCAPTTRCDELLNACVPIEM